MKHLLVCLLGVTLIHSAQAQLFTSESLGGAALGGIAGAIIGNQHHGQSGEGAAIGAGIGYVLGNIVHRNRQYRERTQAYYGDAAYNSSHYPYYGYNQPYGGSAYAYPGRRPNYAIGGAALGGIAGAIIGNQHHGQSGEGAAIGAAAGLVLGGLAERNARMREQAAYAQATMPRMYEPITPAQNQSTASAASTAPQNQTQPKPRPAPVSPMKGANRLFGR